MHINNKNTDIMKNTNPIGSSSINLEPTSDPDALSHALNQDSNTVEDLAKKMLADTRAAIKHLDASLSSPLSLSTKKHHSRTEDKDDAIALQPQSLEFPQSLSLQSNQTPSSAESPLPSTSWALSLYKPAISSPSAQDLFNSQLRLPFSLTLPTAAPKAPSPFTILIKKI